MFKKNILLILIAMSFALSLRSMEKIVEYRKLTAEEQLNLGAYKYVKKEPVIGERFYLLAFEQTEKPHVQAMAAYNLGFKKAQEKKYVLAQKYTAFAAAQEANQHIKEEALDLLQQLKRALVRQGISQESAELKTTDLEQEESFPFNIQELTHLIPNNAIELALCSYSIRGNLKETEYYLLDALSLDDPYVHGQAYASLGTLYCEKGEQERAKEFLNKAIAQDANPIAKGFALQTLGAVLLESQPSLDNPDDQETKDAIVPMQKLTPHNLLRIALCKQMAHNDAEAEIFYQAIIKQAENKRIQAQAWFGLGVIYSAQGKRELAQQFLQQAIDQEVNIIAKGNAMQCLGQIIVAVAKAGPQVLVSDSDPVEAPAQPQASESLEQHPCNTTELTAENAWALGTYHHALTEQNKSAAAFYEIALMSCQDPKEQLSICVDLGCVYFLLNEVDKATTYLEQAFNQDIDQNIKARAMVNLGLIKLKSKGNPA